MPEEVSYLRKQGTTRKRSEFKEETLVGFNVVTVKQHMAAFHQRRPRQINDCMVISLGKHPRQTPYMIRLGL